MATTFIIDQDGDQVAVDKEGNLQVRARLARVKDAFQDNQNTDKHYNTPMDVFSISHDGAVGAADLTFTIGAFTIAVKATETFEDAFPPFQDIHITTTQPFRAIVKA